MIVGVSSNSLPVAFVAMKMLESDYLKHCSLSRTAAECWIHKSIRQQRPKTQSENGSNYQSCHLLYDSSSARPLTNINGVFGPLTEMGYNQSSGQHDGPPSISLTAVAVMIL